MSINIYEIRDFFKSGDSFDTNSKKSFMNLKKKIIKEYANLNPDTMDIYFYFDYDIYSKALWFKLSYINTNYPNSWARDKINILCTTLPKEEKTSNKVIRFINFLERAAYIIDKVGLNVKFDDDFIDLYKQLNISCYFDDKDLLDSIFAAEKLPEVLYNLIKKEKYNVRECLEFLLENSTDVEAEINSQYEKLEKEKAKKNEKD